MTSPSFRRLPLLFLTLALAALFGACDSEGTTSTPLVLWRLVFDGDTLQNQAGLPGALLTVWGRGENDVWLAGGTQKDTDKPTILHWTGSAWSNLPLDVTGTVWWVAGAPNSEDNGASDAIWLAGTGGLVVRYAPAQNKYVHFPVPASIQLWGILPWKDTDVWAVGGDAAQCHDNLACGAIWHFDGAKWAVPTGLPAGWNTTAWFKVFGRSATDVYVCGLNGHILHWDGTAWTDDAVTSTRLLTGACNGKLCIAVGGEANGKIVENDGTGWHEVQAGNGLDLLNGVTVRADGTATAVGIPQAHQGIWRRSADGVWTADDGAPAALNAYHAVFTDAQGGEWAVGGDLYNFRKAQLAVRGSSKVGTPQK